MSTNSKKSHEVYKKMVSIEDTLKNIEKSLADLKAVLVQEEILTQSEDSGELVSNQDPEAVAAYKARQMFDIRF